MSQKFNHIERVLARALNGSPRIKKIAKSIYSRIVFQFNAPTSYMSSMYRVEKVIEGNRETFFGYYDKSPVNNFGDLLVYATDISTANGPSATNSINLLLVDGQSKEVKASLPVRSYNWQQGARAQWLTDEVFIFNDFDPVKQKYFSRVVSSETFTELKTIQRPVQDGYKTDYILSINYEVLQVLRPDYGYRNLPKLTKSQVQDPDNGGIWRVSYATLDEELIVSMYDIFSVGDCETNEGITHKINHVMISPNGKRFIFIHRYFSNSVKCDRLFVSHNDGSNLKVVSDFGMVSHSAWIDNTNIVSYLKGSSGKNGYYIVNVDTCEMKLLLDGDLHELGDGHPTVNDNLIVVDTYPNKSRMQTLLKIDLATNETEIIGEFFHDFKHSGESRCDLHPRFSPDGSSVYIDSIFTGTRSLYKINLSNNVNG